MRQLLKITLIALFTVVTVAAGASASLHGVDAMPLMDDNGRHEAGGASRDGHDEGGLHCCAVMAEHCVGFYLRADACDAPARAPSRPAYLGNSAPSPRGLGPEAATPPPRI